MKTALLATASLFLATAIARPSSAPHYHPQKRAAAQSATDILIKIAPTSASCADATADVSSECATAADATQPIIDAFVKYNVATPGEQAALLSWMAFETAEFKYVRNHFPAPGRPGQGTRAMMMPNFVSEYAGTLGLTNADPAGLLDDVIKAGGEWGAASWYYTTKCTDDVKTGVQTGGKAGWEKFVTDCVQTTMDDGRVKYWTASAQALGMATT